MDALDLIFLVVAMAAAAAVAAGLVVGLVVWIAGSAPDEPTEVCPPGEKS